MEHAQRPLLLRATRKLRTCSVADVCRHRSTRRVFRQRELARVQNRSYVTRLCSRVGSRGVECGFERKNVDSAVQTTPAGRAARFGWAGQLLGVVPVHSPRMGWSPDDQPYLL